jgi:hypothetical protein
MKRLLVLLMAIPMFLSAQEKTVVTANRVFPKPGKWQQFEKALAAHVQKYHNKGDFAWRVYTIETGPDQGGYHIVEGPTTWDAIDHRGDLGAAHTTDWETNCQSLLSERSSVSYSTYRADLSSVGLTDYSDKIVINHMFYKPGYNTEMQELLKTLKKTWDDNGQFVAVYELSASGEPQYATVTRYKLGLKERETGFRSTMPVAFAKANGGQSAWEKYRETFKQAVDHSWSEMLFYKPAVSRKE